MIRSFMAFAAVLMLSQSVANAALVTASVDDFTTPGMTQVFDNGTIQVNRIFQLGGLHAGSGYVVLPGDLMVVTYQAVGGTFGDLFSQETGFSASEFTGFTLSASSGGAGSITMISNGGAGIVNVSGALSDYFFAADASTTFVSFNVAANGGAMTVGFGSGFQAVPEPSALLLVGSVLAACGVARRRRS